MRLLFIINILDCGEPSHFLFTMLMKSCRSVTSDTILRKPWPFLMLSRKPSSLMCMSRNILIAPACVVPDSHPSWNTHERTMGPQPELARHATFFFIDLVRTFWIDVSHSSLHFLSILCHKTCHSFAANNLTSSHAKKSKSVGQFVRYNQFCDVMFTPFLAEIRHMFGSLSKPHLWMELQTKSGIHVELSALQNGYLEFSDFWVFDPKIFQ